MVKIESSVRGARVSEGDIILIKKGLEGRSTPPTDIDHSSFIDIKYAI